MAINLSKGGRINITKENPGLRVLRIALGWDPNKGASGYNYDLDASAFILERTSTGKPCLVNEEYLVFYNNPTTPDGQYEKQRGKLVVTSRGAVSHSGDSLTGEENNDADEVITVDLDKLEALNVGADEVSFIVTIHEAERRRQNFGQIPNSFISIFNDESGELIARYELNDQFTSETAVQFGSVFKNSNGEWEFKAIGAGYKADLGAFVEEYCMIVDA